MSRFITFKIRQFEQKNLQKCWFHADAEWRAIKNGD